MSRWPLQQPQSEVLRRCVTPPSRTRLRWPTWTRRCSVPPPLPSADDSAPPPPLHHASQRPCHCSISCCTNHRFHPTPAPQHGQSLLTAALAATLSLDQGSLFRLFHCVWSPRHYWQAGSRHPLPTAPRRASRLLTGREGVQARGPPAELAQLGRILLRARTARLCLSLHVHCMCTACALHVHVHCMCTACALHVDPGARASTTGR